MGLDQWAYEVTTDEDGNCEEHELMYWRKHNRLQGWMENLWVEQTGKPAEELNCADLPLDLEDIEALEKAIRSKDLPETGGFFYGSDSYERYQEWYAKDDKKFIEMAKKALAEGSEVIYRCWW